MSEHFNKLQPAEDERLALLAEECAEVIQAVAKIQRHGYDSCDPTNPQCPGNRKLLEVEAGQVAHALALMIKAGDITQEGMDAAFAARIEKVKKYLHHQAEIPSPREPVCYSCEYLEDTCAKCWKKETDKKTAATEPEAQP